MGKLLSSLSSALSGTTAGTNSATPHPTQTAQMTEPAMGFAPVSIGAQSATPNMSVASPQVPGISLGDLTGQPSVQAPVAPIDNPYTPYDNTGTPTDVANNVGTSDKGIEITGDNWKPKHESLLGKIGDLMIGKDVFRDRTDQANLESAMQGFQKNPEQMMNRVRQVDPKLAWDMYHQQSEIKANQALEEQRQQDRQDKGRDRLGSMVGSVVGKPNAEALYNKQLPLFNSYADAYHLPHLPDKYDPDVLDTMQKQGISVYDQGRLAQEGASAQNLQNYRNTEISLSKLGKQIDLANLNERVTSDRNIEDRLDKGQVLVAREKAAKEGVTKDADGNSIGMGVTLNSFFAPYMGMKRGQYVVSPDKTQVLMKRADGYIYKYPLAHREDGSAYIDLDNPIIRGTTVDGYMSK